MEQRTSRLVPGTPAAGGRPSKIWRKPLSVFLFLLFVGGCGWFSVGKISEFQTKASEGATIGKLAMLRGALQDYYGKTEGKYPANLEEIKQYLPGPVKDIPFARTFQHGKNGAVQYVSGDDYRAGKISDTGGWAYVNTPGDKEQGLLVVNCVHLRYKQAQPQPWYKY